MFRSSLAVRAKWQKNCQQQDASSERELRPKSFTWNSDSVNAHLSLPFHTLLLTVLCLYGAILHAAIYDTVIAHDRTTNVIWFAGPEYPILLLRMQQPMRRRTQFVYHCIRSPKRRSTRNFSCCWQRFQKEQTRRKASVLGKQSRIVF